MKVKKVSLTNYRGAQDLSMDLNPQLNVFVGVNGSGKSTVLDAIAIMLSWAVSRINRAGAAGRPIVESDISNGKSTASIELSCETEGRTVGWKLSKVRKGYAAEDRTNLQELNEYAKEIQNRISETSENVNLPIFDYYPVNRAVLDIPLRIRGRHSFGLLAAYEGALTSGADFRTFFEWFREREDLENEILRHRRDQETQLDQKTRLTLRDYELHYGNENTKNAAVKPGECRFPDPQLEAVRTALSRFLPEFSNLTVRRQPLRMEVEKNGKPFTVNQLSDGEKCLIALIGDLARRLAILNPVSANPLEGTGIVLIDEIDLHLHPKWQRMVVPKLLDVFPNCQFIVSTHSPSVITHVQHESLFLLKQTDSGIVAEKPGESYGKTVDRVLEDLMGLETTRPNEVESDLDTIFETINAGKIEEARNLISALKEKIGADPELVKAEVLIKRKELIGK
ncbi:AAA family ATPase [Methanosarcina sp. KYL-1]|uniref:AAA family ATPase n=1 Tax=Methanosarcina sp. KYL-1 TaxID=2602068 RepID=UPI002100C3CA|nr:AAA family ATPase [Methanosarcina sp. KYL-1]MCQ1535563.1 AAA family ATPase [Methanosarcina sp. KYL-1]